jgi:hypothetical protein
VIAAVKCRECERVAHLLARIREVVGYEAEALDNCVGRKQALMSRARLLDLLDEMKERGF